ncbi:hypothetical protein DFQ30_009004 [Apophysomyces sp. BC1015]|nr:hypothetical protein DFQ30_009004 [Apophysomyces sp. BC1015]
MTDADALEDTVTAVDIVQQQVILEQEAQEALPGKFESCTFELGYVRQPLYACKTCGSDQAGMCYSCSIACHADHELYELFPKRQFRCDCGIDGKFKHPCQLMTPLKQKTRTNDNNAYNHNFQGHYCRCDRMYDPNQEEGTMFQCVACEDWFHEACIGDIPPEIADFENYICRDCTARYPFLINDQFVKGLCKTREAPIGRWIMPKTKEDVNQTQESDELDITTEDQQTAKRKLPEDDEENQTADKKKMFTDNKIEYLLEEEKTYEPEEDEDAGNIKPGQKKKKKD